MNLASRPASRWAVSARTNGEVLTAGISRSDLELTVLGLPGGYSQLEIEGWLSDLAGVAVETSRADSRPRAIPALMHHALTGLLFSHAELWDRLEAPRPCSSAFVDLPEGAAFGWVGEARVHVLVDGDPVEPQWVRVRDDEGREGRAAVFAPGSDVVVTLEYWPDGEGAGVAPASLEAEWVDATDASESEQDWSAEPDSAAEPAREVTPAWFASAAVETAGVEPSRAVAPSAPEPEPESEQVFQMAPLPAPVESAPAAFTAEPYPELSESLPESLPETLPDQQPGLAASAHELRRESSGVPELVVPFAGSEDFVRESFEEPPFVTATRDVTRGSESQAAHASFEDAPPRAPRAWSEPAQQKPAHPVARWLARVMKWGRSEPAAHEPRLTEREPVVAATDGAPVSAYDALLSESVPPTSLEQTAFELPASAPATAAHASASSTRPLAAPAPGALRPAGLAEILGVQTAGAPVAGAPPAPAPAASPGASPSGSIAINEKLQALLREIEAAEAGALPVLSPELPQAEARETLEIDHEPVGADESFGIARLPSSLTLGPREENRNPAIPALPPPPRPSAASPPRPPALQSPPEFTPPSPERFASSLDVPAPVRLSLETVSIALPPEVVAAPVAPQFEAAAIAPPPPLVATPATPVESVPASPPVLRVALPSRESVAAAIVRSGAIEPEVEPIEGFAAIPAASPAEPAGAAPVAPDEEPLFPRVTRRARTLEGPESFERPKLRLPRRAGMWAGGIVAVFVLGWLVGGLANPGADRGGPVMAALRAIGIGGAHFTVSVNSSPGGALIEIDGKAQTSRTPATLELSPGEHVVRLVLPSLGAVEVPVKGRGGEKLSVDESLNGSLEILDTDAKVPISVSVDGKPAGYAPLRVESIAPGLHEIGFSGPGMPAWAQTVQVEVRSTAQLIARPMTAPANGVIQAQATINDERGALPLSGAQVYVDGELRGVTPLSVELPRGPHSLRVTWRGETAPVQVIELPGGNQRFASFNFGLDLEAPRLTPIGSTKSFASDQPKMVSAAVEGLAASDVSEAWLHLRTPEGIWRRYAMTVLRGAGGLVITSVFPDNVFDKQGATRWYVRVVTPQGDEAFSEVQRSVLATAAGTAAR